MCFFETFQSLIHIYHTFLLSSTFFVNYIKLHKFAAYFLCKIYDALLITFSISSLSIYHLKLFISKMGLAPYSDDHNTRKEGGIQNTEHYNGSPLGSKGVLQDAGEYPASDRTVGRAITNVP